MLKDKRGKCGVWYALVLAVTFAAAAEPARALEYVSQARWNDALPLMMRAPDGDLPDVDITSGDVKMPEAPQT
ncbi:MAG: hypothetical protein LBU13_05020 [Synergistaceae bacterium]|jgi:hypothetical protein|nr:hypothetical protein [Synergistaceae bacterium]